MRWVLLPLLCGTAAADPMWDAEVRAGYGRTSTHSSSMTLAGVASFAIETEPALSAYAGLSLETMETASVGSLFGVKLTQGPIRLSGGGAWVFAPLTLWGVTGSIGACKRIGSKFSTCGDLELTAYFAGTAMDEGKTMAQAAFVVGFVVDGGE